MYPLTASSTADFFDLPSIDWYAVDLSYYYFFNQQSDSHNKTVTFVSLYSAKFQDFVEPQWI